MEAPAAFITLEFPPDLKCAELLIQEVAPIWFICIAEPKKLFPAVKPSGCDYWSMAVLFYIFYIFYIFEVELGEFKPKKPLVPYTLF